MTKPRNPGTFWLAVMRIAERIGFDGCAQVLGHTENFVRKLSDPDAGRDISLQDALRLDLAFKRAGGEGAPLLECYALLVEMADDSGRASMSQLIAIASNAARECGEAVSAALVAIENGAEPDAVRKALKEIEEGVASLTAMGVGLGGGKILGVAGGSGRRD